MLSISKTAKLKSEEWILALSKTKSIGISKDNKSRIMGLSKFDNNLFSFLFYLKNARIPRLLKSRMNRSFVSVKNLTDEFIFISS